MMSFDRKNRAVNAHDIASQLKYKEQKSLKSLKSKNKELLKQYREKLRTNSPDDSETKSESRRDLDDSDANLIPKDTSESFRGVVFDDEDDQDTEQQNRGKKRNYKRKNTGQGKDKGKSRFKKFKPFNRSKKGNNKKPKQDKQRF